MPDSDRDFPSDVPDSPELVSSRARGTSRGSRSTART
jgi:hypothetical protein